MQVKEVMSKNPRTMSEEATLAQAAAEMEKNNCGFLPIKHNGKLSGVLTDRDIIIRMVAKGKDPNKIMLREAMTKNVCSCHEDDDVSEAVKMMCDKHISRLAVYNKEDQLCGVVSIRDIAKRCSKDHSMTEKVCECICKE